MRYDFLVEITRRKIIERYVGTSFRIFWVLLAPLIPLLMNLAVFYYIANIPQVRDMGASTYAAFIFSGLLPFRFIQKAATEANDLLIGNLEMLKSASFPLPFLSYSAVGALAVDLLIQGALMAALLIISGEELTWRLLLLPIAVAMLLAMGLGASWLLSVVGYLLRDMQEIMMAIFSALLYVTPTMYPPEAAPEFMQKLIYLNPLTHLIVVFRDTIMPDKSGIHWDSWVIFFIISILMFVIGLYTIRKAQLYVADMV